MRAVRFVLLFCALGMSAPAAFLVEPPLNLVLAGGALTLSVFVLAVERRDSASQPGSEPRRRRMRRSAEVEHRLLEALEMIQRQSRSIAEMSDLQRRTDEVFQHRLAEIDARLAAIEADRIHELTRRRRRSEQSERFRTANQQLERETHELEQVLTPREPM